jgi:hypothetical protein
MTAAGEQEADLLPRFLERDLPHGSAPRLFILSRIGRDRGASSTIAVGQEHDRSAPAAMGSW